jgi:pimeloyl-ACP methyl ester carboxylesterase
MHARTDYAPVDESWITFVRMVPGDAFATINGHRLRYRRRGAGPLAVFGHGLLGSLEQIEENLPAVEELHARLDLVVYDARGHGQSDGPDDAAAYTWETLGQDMAALVEHAGGRPAFVGGASMGAATALWVALERPELVRALVLVMPPPLGGPSLQSGDEKRALQVLDMLSAAIQNFGMEQTVALARQFPGFANSPEEADERAAWLRRQSPRALAHAVRGLIRAPFHTADDYARIRVPTLVMAHDGDGLHPLRAAELLADAMPDCRLVTAPDPGYWRREPGAFLAEIHAFLDRVS